MVVFDIDQLVIDNVQSFLNRTVQPFSCHATALSTGKPTGKRDGRFREDRSAMCVTCHAQRRRKGVGEDESWISGRLVPVHLDTLRRRDRRSFTGLPVGGPLVAMAGGHTIGRARMFLALGAATWAVLGFG